MKILVTGVAGFIGMHVSRFLLSRGDDVLGIDNLNDYYDPALKAARLQVLNPFNKFSFVKGDISDRALVANVFDSCQFDAVIHLAAQAGVRYSVTNPHAYADSNLEGFLNILEGCRQHKISHLVFASSSSVYGGNRKMPFRESDPVDHPISLYAATKRANELMAHSYSHLYGIPITGLRFFTVYGPWGRPDQSLFLFLSAMLAGKPIKVFNQGQMRRDFTYIDDIVQGVVRVLDKPATSDVLFNPLDPLPGISKAPFRLFNIGNNVPVPLMEFISAIEDAAGIVAQKEFLPMQPGDVEETYADTSLLENWVDFKPSTVVKDGLSQFVKWYRDYYNT